MNGGRKKWLEEKRPLTTEAPKVTQATYHSSGPDESLRARKEDVFAVIAKTWQADSWSTCGRADEFTGKIIAPPGMNETAQRAGHIPTAANIPWAQAANEDGTFKSADQLKQLYDGKGVKGSGEVIAYCRIGERSSHTWFVLKYLLGYDNVKNYDGSWTEWGNLVGAPIEKEVAAARALDMRVRAFGRWLRIELADLVLDRIDLLQEVVAVFLKLLDLRVPVAGFSAPRIVGTRGIDCLSASWRPANSRSAYRSRRPAPAADRSAGDTS